MLIDHLADREAFWFNNIDPKGNKKTENPRNLSPSNLGRHTIALTKAQQFNRPQRLQLTHKKAYPFMHYINT